jgi:hypothetical protein
MKDSMGRLEKRWQLYSGWESEHQSSVISSSSNCQHFEHNDNGNTEVDEDGVWVTLDKNVVMYRGQIPFAPVPMFDYITGLTHFTYNEEEDKLEYYDLGSGVLHLAKFDAPPVFHRSPIDGKSRTETAFPITADAREQTVEKPNWKARAAYNVYNSMPNDRRMFFQDEDDACPDKKKEKLTEKMNKITTYKTFYGIGQDENYKGASLSDQMNLLGIVAKATPCGVDWMQSPLPNSHGYDLFEGLVWSHFIMEAPDGNKGAYVFYDGWNWPPADLTIKITQVGNGAFYQDRPESNDPSGSLLQKREDAGMTAAEKTFAEDAITCHNNLLDEIGSGRVPTFECPEWPESLKSLMR